MQPPATLGLRHLALYSTNLEICADFYVSKLQMKIVWQPDADNIYLSSGADNLALHRAPQDFVAAQSQRLDHLGFFLKTPADVDAWYMYLKDQNVHINMPPKDHRDGTRSFYCSDPDGNVIQMIYYPLD